MKKQKTISRSWYLLNADDQKLGRVSSQAARLLMGKHKIIYQPNLDCGDFVVIININKLNISPKKLITKKYYSHSGHLGKLKEKTAKEYKNQNPKFIIRHAILGMLPNNKLKKYWIKRLKIYLNSHHQHQAQKIKEYKLK